MKAYHNLLSTVFILIAGYFPAQGDGLEKDTIMHPICSNFRHFWPAFQYYLKTDSIEKLKEIFNLPNEDKENFYTDYSNLFSNRIDKNLIVNLNISAIEKSDNETNTVWHMPDHDSICDEVYVFVDLCNSKEATPCTKGMLMMYFNLVEGEYKLESMSIAL